MRFIETIIYSRRREKSRGACRNEKHGRVDRGDGDDMSPAPSNKVRFRTKLRIATTRGDYQAISHFGAISHLNHGSPKITENEAFLSAIGVRKQGTVNPQ